jgi:hypothetical protein
MERALGEVALQAPALGLVVLLVVMFLRHLDKRDERDRERERMLAAIIQANTAQSARTEQILDGVGEELSRLGVLRRA